MVQIPTAYPPVAAPAIASYDYTDIAEGTGVVVFQGFDARRGPGEVVTWHLAKGVSFNSFRIEDLDSQTHNFNLSPFNMPTTVKGTAIIRFCSKCSTENTVTVKLQKVNLDASVTDIGSVVTTTMSGGTIFYHILHMSLTQTHFKKGETLRLNLVASVANVMIGHDPANRDGTTITPAATYPTKLEAAVPFRIDL